MTTRAQFRAVLRETMSVRSHWPDTLLNIWIGDAIRDYSNYFSRQLEAILDCVAGQREYSLVTLLGIQGVLMVEYPVGEDPPRYLARRPETGGFAGLPVYDLRGEPPHALVIGEEPDADDDIGLVYTADHAVPANDTDALTMPDRHLEALKLFVIWQAVRELELNEATDPDTTNMLLSMLGLNSVRAERMYRSRLDDFRQKVAAPGGYAGPWVSDANDKVY